MPKFSGIHLHNLPSLLFSLPTRLEGKKVFICMADHYEPKWANPTLEVARERVDRWRREYPRCFSDVKDSRGRSPQHSFFYPAEEYEREFLDKIAELCRMGFGDVEIHLHHDNDTADNLRSGLVSFAEVLANDHGLLRRDEQGRIRYAFIHGNWALDNSRSDGRWCGVNNEIDVLIETGCYCDMTMPSAPADCQTSTINSIYYAQDDPNRPNSHDRGVRSRVGSPPPESSLLMIQGPLGLDFHGPGRKFVPYIDNGDLSESRPPWTQRAKNWLNANIRVDGADDWIFVKLYTHGTQEEISKIFFGEPMQELHQEWKRLATKHAGFEYFYVTAFEMASLVHQAESGIKVPRFEKEEIRKYAFGPRFELAH